MLRDLLAKTIGQPGENAPTELTRKGFPKPKKIAKSFFVGKGAPRGQVNPTSTNGIIWICKIYKKGCYV
jgi:hypothetical protein